MAQNNHVKLIGKLGFDPEIRELAVGRKVARMSLAVAHQTKTSSGEWVNTVESPTWHTLVAWGSLADRAEKELKKGSPIAIDGRLVYRTYEVKSGTKHYITEIVLSDFTILPTP